MTFRHPGDLAVTGVGRASGVVRATARYAARGADAARDAIGGLERRAAWAVADQCVVSAANFFTVFLFARHLDAAVFGGFVLAYTGLLLLTNMQNALVAQPHNVLGAGLAEPAYRRFTGAMLALQALYCAGTCAALGAVGWLVGAAFSPDAGVTITTLALTAVPWLGQEFVRRVLYTRGESRAAAANDVITYGLQLFGALALVVAVPEWATPAAALNVLGLSSAVGVLAGVWQLRGHVRFGDGAARGLARHWSDAWRFGRWLTAQNGLAWFGAQGHSWIVGLVLGIEQVGIYRAATHLVNVMNPLMQACFSYLPSRGSLVYRSRGASGLSRWVKQTLRTLLLAMTPFLALLVLLPGPVLEFAYGSGHAAAELPLILALAALAQCVLFTKYPFDLGLLALRSTHSIFLVYLIPVAMLLTLGTALIYLLGILGVPLSAIAINSALLLATWRAYRRRMALEPAAAAGGNPR